MDLGDRLAVAQRTYDLPGLDQVEVMRGLIAQLGERHACLLSTQSMYIRDMTGVCSSATGYAFRILVAKLLP